MRRLSILVPLLACTLLTAAEPAVSAFQAAMGGQDQGAKKAAIAALADKSVGRDDDILPLLVQAVADRQAHDAAVAALRTRTGLQPAPTRGAGGYPAYPADDTAAAWSGWLSARTAARAAEEQIKANAKAAEEAKLAAAKAAELARAEGDAPAKTGIPADSADPADAAPADGAEAAAKPEPGRDPEFGGLDRLTFKTGGSLLCYVLGKRLDADGNLVSVRIMHLDQGGEEILASELIARIEEDIK